MLRSIAFFVTFAFASNGFASEAANCGLVSEPMNYAATSIRQLVTALEGMPADAMEHFTGDERDAIARLEQLRRPTIAALVAYANQAEDTAYILRKCARQ